VNKPPDISSDERIRIAVVGGGISGLAAAHRITELLPRAELAVFEAADRLGGVVQTIRRDEYLVERGADSFSTNLPWAADLCQRLGLTGELMPTQEQHRRALVVRHGKLMPVPEGFLVMSPSKLWPLLSSRVLSWSGKLRLLAEPLVRRRSPAGTSDLGLGKNLESRVPKRQSLVFDESVASFATRRLGREAFERLVQPLLAGIYTADAAKLSMAATMPEFLADEQQYGSLLRAVLTRAAEARRERKPGTAKATKEGGARYGLFLAPRDGMGALVETLGQRLPAGSVRLGTRVERFERREDAGFSIHISTIDKSEPESSTECSNSVEQFDALILALPAHESARLVGDNDLELAAQLKEITFASAVVVGFGYRRDQVDHPLDGFGLVVPQVEGRQIIAASFASIKFAGRAPAERVLIRAFVGGALHPELTELSDGRLCHMAHEELSQLLGISGQPLWSDVARWPCSMPQYHVGHLQRVEQIERRTAAWPGLELAGNAYHGVGIPQCIHSGELAAQRVAAWCAKRTAVADSQRHSP
jgi:oxygen-dependent protoporphyrinogen oxidase